MSFWDIVWFFFIGFAFAAYLMVLFRIVEDLFRDPDASGSTKAAWVVALIFLPFASSVVYLISRGTGMAHRSARIKEEAMYR
jgi:hypothetical protein